MIIPIGSGKCALRPFLAHHVILLGRQFLLPLFFSLHNALARCSLFGFFGTGWCGGGFTFREQPLNHAFSFLICSFAHVTPADAAFLVHYKDRWPGFNTISAPRMVIIVGHYRITNAETGDLAPNVLDLPFLTELG